MTENSFLGYGSPEALEAAIKVGEDEDFVVYGTGLVHSSVCSSLPQEEVVARMASRITGISSGWALSEEQFKGGEDNPCPCNLDDTRKHYLFVC